MRVLVATFAILSASLAFACDDVRIRGSGDLVTEEYEFEDFTKVELTNAFRADIRHSDEFSVSVEVDDNILELVEVSKQDDTLRLQVKSGTSTTDVTLNATITMPDLYSLELSGASQATVTGFENMDSFQARLSGASRLEGNLDVRRLDLRLSGASSASFGGRGIEADLNASGASSLDLEDFLLETARITVSGASLGTVTVRDELGPVKASGASHLHYIGRPTLAGVDTSGASTVKPAE